MYVFHCHLPNHEDKGRIAIGDGAYEIGRATLTLAGGQRATPKYAVIWKQEDGVWRRHVDIWNMDTA